jgi:hypothetical protein
MVERGRSPVPGVLHLERKILGVVGRDAGTWQALGGKGILASISPGNGATNLRKIML